MPVTNLPQEARELSHEIRMTPLPEEFWGYLTPAAAAILKTPQDSTVIEVGEGDDKEFKLCRYFCKIAYLNEAGEIPDSILKKAAATMNLLVDDGKINYGILAHPAILPLASGELEVPDFKKSAEEAQQRWSSGDEKTTDKEIIENFPTKKVDMGPPRVAILIYVFSDFETEELNSHLNGNKAFAEEGDLGSDNWDNLPG